MSLSKPAPLSIGKTKNYILLGPPGSGKSTQAEELRKKKDLAHIDIGAELRAAAEEESDLGRKLNDIVNKKRELVSDDLMQAVFQRALARVPAEKGVLLDGAPRRESQIDEVERAFGRLGRTLSRVIFINISESISVERIARRYRCFGCHRPYILGEDLLDPDKPCAFCGGKIGQRKDDTRAGVEKRYQIFSAETLPVIEYFRSKGLLLEIDGTEGQEKISQLLGEALAESSALSS